MAVINFSFKSPSWSLLLPESMKFGQNIHVWHDVPIWVSSWALVEKNSFLRVDLAMSPRRVSVCVAIVTKVFQEVTHANQLSVLLGQHGFNNFCSLTRLILKKVALHQCWPTTKKMDFLIEKSIFGWNSTTGKVAFQSNFKF